MGAVGVSSGSWLLVCGGLCGGLCGHRRGLLSSFFSKLGYITGNGATVGGTPFHPIMAVCSEDVPL